MNFVAPAREQARLERAVGGELEHVDLLGLLLDGAVGAAPRVDARQRQPRRAERARSPPARPPRDAFAPAADSPTAEGAGALPSRRRSPGRSRARRRPWRGPTPAAARTSARSAPSSPAAPRRRRREAESSACTRASKRRRAAVPSSHAVASVAPCASNRQSKTRPRWRRGASAPSTAAGVGAGRKRRPGGTRFKRPGGDGRHEGRFDPWGRLRGNGERRGAAGGAPRGTRKARPLRGGAVRRGRRRRERDAHRAGPMTEQASKTPRAPLSRTRRSRGAPAGPRGRAGELAVRLGRHLLAGSRRF